MGPPLEIGVICATDEEWLALSRTFQLHHRPAEGPFPMVEGGVIHLAQSGIGKSAVAALTAHMLTARPQIELVVFCGVAGAMDPDLHPGDLVIGTETATHDYGACRGGRFDWFRSGDIPIGDSPPPRYEPASIQTPALRRTVETFAGRAGAPRVVLGRIISGDIFLNCRVRRDELDAQWGAQAIDMESAAFAEVARRFGRPILILRTISDRACEESHLSYQEIAASAARNSAQFLAAHLADLERDQESLGIIRRWAGWR